MSRSVVALTTTLLLVCVAGNVFAQQPWKCSGSKAGQEITGPDGGIMVWVPPGEFMMGSATGRPDEGPARRVRITRGFWLGKFEVTNAQYDAFRKATGHRPPTDSLGIFCSDQGPDHPVVWVNWGDALLYCRHYGLLLPTEAQWEYAARGSKSLTYPWGNDWNERLCCNCQNKGPKGRTFPVGAFPQGVSWCGAQDLAGNVWEYCLDLYDEHYYAHSPLDNPGGPAEPEGRPTFVSRGGSYHQTPFFENVFGCTVRHADWGDRWEDRGFRVSFTP